FYAHSLALHSFPTRRSSDLPFPPSPTASTWAVKAPPTCALPPAPTSSTSTLPPTTWPMPLPRLSCGPAASTSCWPPVAPPGRGRSEEHTSELQSREKLVCRL